MPHSSAPIVVAHLLPWDTVGGVEIATLRVAQAAAGAGIRNIAFCHPEAQPVAEFFARAGFPTVSYHQPRVSYRHALQFLQESRELAKLLRRERVSVLHCSDLTSAPGGALAGKMAGCKVLCHIRNRFDTIPRREKPPLAMVDHFVFVSQDSWRRLDFKVSKRKGSVLYDGFDRPAVDLAAAARTVREEFGLSSADLIVGMAARIAPQKDHQTLLAAAQIVRRENSNIRFLIVGDNAGTESYRQHYAALRRIVAEKGLEDACVFTGHRTDAVRLVAGMDIFVLSTHREGLPLVLLEAMAMQRPVIATAIDGIPELLSDLTGILVPHQDADRLAEAILTLARDSALRVALGSRAAAHVHCQFSRAQFIDHVCRLYRCCGRKTEP